ncbi:MAG: hypothetical protein IT462_16580 [Planctomycetes bacterium]|nr:hypothetical protein [Planctomycetota bacterium]
MSRKPDKQKFLGVISNWDARLWLGRARARRLNNEDLIRVQLPNIHFDDEEEHPEKYDTPEKKIAAIMEDNGGSLGSFNVEMAALSIQEQIYDMPNDQIIAELAKFGIVVSGIEDPPASDDLPF